MTTRPPRPFTGLAALALLMAIACPMAAADKPAGVPAANGSIFQPGGFKSLGKLVVQAGKTVTFDTGTEAAEPAVSGAATGKGELGVSSDGNAQLAVFAFDSIDLADGATVEVTGDRGLVLLCKGAVVVNTAIDLGGKVGATKPIGGKAGGKPENLGGRGGPGGEGGERGKAIKSNPPTATRGDGSPARKDSGESGHGMGGGQNQRCRGGSAGGGGGYGGAGGDASEGSPILGADGKVYAMKGGVAYGDAALKDLLGGSGGAGGSNDRNFSSASGGGGGGAVAIIAVQGIAIGPKGSILASGGPGAVNNVCGGGGSGGGILLAAPTITMQDGAKVDAGGGAGGSGPDVASVIKPDVTRRNAGSGGGGGGGRIAFYTTAGKDQPEKEAPKGVHILGGKGGDQAKDGEPGTFFNGKLPALH